MADSVIPILKKGIKMAASPLTATLILAYLFILVGVTTFLQVYIGIYAAKRIVMDSWWILVSAKGMMLPIAPGGWLTGTVMIASIVAALTVRITWNKKHLGLIVAHLGAIGLLLGAGLSSGLSEEGQLVLAEGQSKNYAQVIRETELAIRQNGVPLGQEVMIPDHKVMKKGVKIVHPKLPFEIKILDVYPNSKMMSHPSEKDKVVPNLATQGAGTQIPLVAQSPVYRDDYRNDPSMFVEIRYQGESAGIFLLSNFIESTQKVMIGQTDFELSLRPKRIYFPIDIFLNDFQHIKHTGTTIPSWFASQVTIHNPLTQEKRDVEISMNHPLRYSGKTFYQASFKDNDTVSVIQVVNNPTWIMPYFSCGIIALGLILHFLMKLNRGVRKG